MRLFTLTFIAALLLGACSSPRPTGNANAVQTGETTAKKAAEAARAAEEANNTGLLAKSSKTGTTNGSESDPAQPTTQPTQPTTQRSKRPAPTVSEVSDTRERIEKARNAVNAHYLKASPKKLPESLEELTKGPSPFVTEVPVDPWGSVLVYEKTGPRSFTVHSIGPDRVDGTPDDVELYAEDQMLEIVFDGSAWTIGGKTADLAPALEAAVAQYDDVVVSIVTPADTPYAEVADLIELARSAGVKHFQYAVQDAEVDEP